MTTWIDFVASLMPGATQQKWVERFVHGSMSVEGNLLSEGASHALRSGFVDGEVLPGDMRELVALARNLPQYPGETAEHHQERLARAWLDWQFAGTDACIEGQLEAAGFTGATIVTHADRIGPRGEPAPYWSQFWVRIPSSSLNLVDPIWGRIRWGTFWWGTGALSENDNATFWGIIRKFKPVDWFCRGIELE
jgi:hypothetical protein